MGFSNKNHDGERNLVAEQRILYGILGAIPAALVASVPGAIASIALGFYGAYRAVADPIKRKEKEEEALKEAVKQSLTARDEWDKKSADELQIILRDDWYSKDKKCYRIIRTFNPDAEMPCRSFPYKYRDGDYQKGYEFTDSLTGNKYIPVEINIRDFFRKFHNEIENGTIEKVRILQNDDPECLTGWSAYCVDNILLMPSTNIDMPNGRPF